MERSDSFDDLSSEESDYSEIEIQYGYTNIKFYLRLLKTYSRFMYSLMLEAICFLLGINIRNIYFYFLCTIEPLIGTLRKFLLFLDEFLEIFEPPFNPKDEVEDEDESEFETAEEGESEPEPVVVPVVVPVVEQKVTKQPSIKKSPPTKRYVPPAMRYEGMDWSDLDEEINNPIYISRYFIRK